MNKVVTTWDGIINPINLKKSEALKAAGLDKTKGAKFTHALLGICLLAIADGMSLPDLQKSIKFTAKEPFVKIALAEKYGPLVSSLPAWVCAQFEALPAVEALATEIKDIPGAGTEATKNAPQAFADLEAMERGARFKAAASAVSKIKDKCEAIADDMTRYKGECEDMEAAVERLKAELEGERLLELGAKCRAAGKKTVKDCYECAYEQIKPPASTGQPGSGMGGCCTVF